MPRSKAKPEHYVDNKKLYAEMQVYLNAVKEAEEAGDEKPRIPEYIGECLLKISNRYLLDQTLLTIHIEMK